MRYTYALGGAATATEMNDARRAKETRMAGTGAFRGVGLALYLGPSAYSRHIGAGIVSVRVQMTSKTFTGGSKFLAHGVVSHDLITLPWHSERKAAG